MQLDTRLPLAAAAQAPITFQPESRMQTLSRIAPGINAMRQVQAQRQTQQQEMQRMMQRSAALDEMRRAVQDGDLGKYAQALMNSGDEALMQKGAQLQMADLQDKQFRRQYGGMTGNLTPEGMAALAGAGEKGLGMAKELGRYVVTPQPFAVGKNVFVPGQGFQAPPEAPMPQPQPQILRRGDVLINPATGERIATNVPAVNALTPAAAPTAGGLTQDQTDRILTQQGYRRRPDGTLEPIPGGRADPETLRRQAEARQPPPRLSAFAEKTEFQRGQTIIELDRTIRELENAAKPGGLIDKSTGSGVGAATDVAAGFVGVATPGAVAIGRLQPIADMVLKMVPRFEGPQSDKDTQSYKDAAGQIANPNIPNKIRRDAAMEIVRIMRARKDQFVLSGSEAPAPAPTPAPAPAPATAARPGAAAPAPSPPAGASNRPPLQQIFKTPGR